MFIAADHDLLIGSVNLDHVERRSRGHAQALALSHSEVVDSAVLTDHFPARGHKFASSVRQSLATLGEISVDKALVVAAGDEADLLRVRLLSERQSLLASQFANLGLGHCCDPWDASAASARSRRRTPRGRSGRWQRNRRQSAARPRAADQTSNG